MTVPLRVSALCFAERTHIGVVLPIWACQFVDDRQEQHGSKLKQSSTNMGLIRLFHSSGHRPRGPTTGSVQISLRKVRRNALRVRRRAAKELII